MALDRYESTRDDAQQELGTNDHCLAFAVAYIWKWKFLQFGLCCETEKLDELFTSAGFRVAKSEYVFRRTVNRKEEIDVQRVFVQGKYVKPSCAVSDV